MDAHDEITHSHCIHCRYVFTTIEEGVYRLEIFETTTDDAGEYVVVATNPHGEVTCSATVEIEPKPKEKPKTEKPEFTEVYKQTVRSPIVAFVQSFNANHVWVCVWYSIPAPVECISSNTLFLQTVEVKKNLTLTVKVTGKPEPEIKWFSNGKEIKPTFKIKMTREKEVATLNITGVTKAMTGDYKVVATNSAGATEHVEKIIVVGKLAFSPQRMFPQL